MDKATIIIDTVWWAYWQASLVGPQLHGAVLIKFLTVTRERTGRKGSWVMWVSAVAASQGREGQGWLGSVDPGHGPLYLTM